jgi:hypothetical protein
MASIAAGLALNLIAILLYAISKKGFGTSVADKVHFFLMVLAANIVAVVLILTINLGRAPYLLYHDGAVQLDESKERERVALNEKAAAQLQREEALKKPSERQTVIVHGACKVTEEQLNPVRSQSCPTTQGAPTLSFRDRVLAINARLTESDRNRFSAALAEFEESLTDGRALFYKINEEGGELGNDFRSSGATNSSNVHEKRLAELEDEGWQYQKAFPQMRSKWQQSFNEQTEYIFGDNPDNQGPNALINAVSVYKGFLGAWKAVPSGNNINTAYFVGLASNEYQIRMKMFADWNQGCLNRLTEMRKSIR